MITYLEPDIVVPEVMMCECEEQEMGGGAKNSNEVGRWLCHTRQRRGTQIGVS